MMWENIIWLGVVGFLFLMMFRKGGCCGGHDHGKHTGSQSHEYLDHENKSGDLHQDQHQTAKNTKNSSCHQQGQDPCWIGD